LIEEAADPAKQRQPIPTTIAKAIDIFLADEKGRNLSKETTKQSKTLFQNQFLSWAKHRGLSRLRDLTPPKLVNFRATWENSGLTANRKLSRLVGFFAFCIQNGWLNENPATKVKRSTVHSLPTGWFPKPEFTLAGAGGTRRKLRPISGSCKIYVSIAYLAYVDPARY
jgi:hypothetical protein